MAECFRQHAVDDMFDTRGKHCVYESCRHDQALDSRAARRMCTVASTPRTAVGHSSQALCPREMEGGTVNVFGTRGAVRGLKIAVHCRQHAEDIVVNVFCRCSAVEALHVGGVSNREKWRSVSTPVRSSGDVGAERATRVCKAEEDMPIYLYRMATSTIEHGVRERGWCDAKVEGSFSDR